MFKVQLLRNPLGAIKISCYQAIYCPSYHRCYQYIQIENITRRRKIILLFMNQGKSPRDDDFVRFIWSWLGFIPSLVLPIMEVFGFFFLFIKTYEKTKGKNVITQWELLERDKASNLDLGIAQFLQIVYY